MEAATEAKIEAEKKAHERALRKLEDDMKQMKNRLKEVCYFKVNDDLACFGFFGFLAFYTLLNHSNLHKIVLHRFFVKPFFLMLLHEFVCGIIKVINITIQTNPVNCKPDNCIIRLFA